MNVWGKFIIIIVLAVLIMFFIKKIVQSVFNLITAIKASKNRNHGANAESCEVVINEKTKKLENCKNFIKLPF